MWLALEALSTNGVLFMEAQKYYRRHEVHNYLYEKYKLSASVSWLAKLACHGGGPAFHKAGRWPLYSQDALDAWAKNRLGEAVSSTAEYQIRAA